MPRKTLALAVMLAASVIVCNAAGAQQTRAQLQTYNNNNINTNGGQLITGAIVNYFNNLFMTSTGMLIDDNAFTAKNIFSGTSLADPAAGALQVAGLATNGATAVNGMGRADLSTSNGLQLQGSGSVYDLILQNSNGGTSLGLSTGTPDLVAGGKITASYFYANSGTATLSGSTVPNYLGRFNENLAGTSTVVGFAGGGSNILAMLSTDNAAFPNGGWVNIKAGGNHGGANFDGLRWAIYANDILNTASTLSDGGFGIVGIGSKEIGSANMGGTGAGFGTTNNGLGSVFGSNPWCSLVSGATFYRQCVGEEVDAEVGAGASVYNFAVMQLVTTLGHATHGAALDTMMRLGSNIGAAVGVRNLIIVGDNQSQWPVDPNGYLFQSGMGVNPGTFAPLAAGGIDFNTVTFSGSGPQGGGFAWRSPGALIDSSGRVQSGYGLIDGTSGGLTIKSTEQTLSGTPTVATGGADWITGTAAQDAYGNIVTVTSAIGGVVQPGGISVTRRGWTTSPPGNPVTFVSASAGAMATGLTLNETWVGGATTTLAGNGSGLVALGSGSDGLQFTGTGMITSNGAVATALSSVGPTGSHTTVQEWMVVKNPAGTFRYIPMF